MPLPEPVFNTGPKDYPKWLYHKTQDAVLVESKEEHDTLPGEWAEAPFGPPTAPSREQMLEAKLKKAK